MRASFRIRCCARAGKLSCVIAARVKLWLYSSNLQNRRASLRSHICVAHDIPGLVVREMPALNIPRGLGAAQDACKLTETKVQLADIEFSAHTNRAAVIDGYTVCARRILPGPRLLRRFCKRIAHPCRRANCPRRRDQLSRSGMRRIASSRDSTDEQEKA